MKKYLILFLFYLLNLYSDDVTFVFNSNNNGYLRDCGCPVVLLGGLAERMTVFKEIKSENGTVFFVDGGDILSEFPLKSNDRVVLEVYSKMGYDACYVGDQELMNGLKFFKSDALPQLPFFSGNVTINNTELKSYNSKIVEKNGVKVAFTGFSPKTDYAHLFDSGVITEYVISTDESIDNLNAELKRLKGLADYVVLVVGGDDYFKNTVSENATNYDILFGVNGDEEMDNYKFTKSEAIHLSSGVDGEYLVKLVLEGSKDNYKIKEYELIPLDSEKIERDKEIDGIILKYEN